ncbi:hypothetical protein [Plantactinospora sp. DSM 117369]
MSRRGRSTTIGKIAKLYQDRRVSEMRMLGELLRQEQRAKPDRAQGSTPDKELSPSDVRESTPAR